jgi:pyrroloquinoline quinone biosynthesis protein D
MQFIRLMPKQITDDIRPRLARGVRLQADDATGKTVLLFPEGILELNETAGEILIRCDGRTLRDILCELADEYDEDPKTLAADVHETLLDLENRKLVQL